MGKFLSMEESGLMGELVIWAMMGRRSFLSSEKRCSMNSELRPESCLSMA